MLLTLRGVPTIYFGDEQGFGGKGGDQDARQDMFASRVATYNEDKLLGTSATTAQVNFNPDHPLYREIAQLARIRTSHRALTRGRQVVRYSQDKPGLFAIARFDPASGREMLLLFNTSTAPIRQNVRVETRSTTFETLAGDCPAEAAAPRRTASATPPATTHLRRSPRRRRAHGCGCRTAVAPSLTREPLADGTISGGSGSAQASSVSSTIGSSASRP